MWKRKPRHELIQPRIGRTERNACLERPGPRKSIDPMGSRCLNFVCGEQETGSAVPRQGARANRRGSLAAVVTANLKPVMPRAPTVMVGRSAR